MGGYINTEGGMTGRSRALLEGRQGNQVKHNKREEEKRITGKVHMRKRDVCLLSCNLIPKDGFLGGKWQC